MSQEEEELGPTMVCKEVFTPSLAKHSAAFLPTPPNEDPNLNLLRGIPEEKETKEVERSGGKQEPIEPRLLSDITSVELALEIISTAAIPTTATSTSSKKENIRRRTTGEDERRKEGKVRVH